MMTKKQFNKIIKMTPMIVVDGVIIKNDSILMIKRAHEPFKNCWMLPGGFVEYKEKLEDAIVREVFEETGLKTKVRKFVGVYSDPDRDPRGHVISLCFLLNIVGGKIRGNEESTEIKFFKRLPNNIGADHRKMINDAIKLIKKVKK